jgi:hypothetical protein
LVVIQTRRDDIRTSEFVSFTAHNVFLGSSEGTAPA